MTILDEKEPTVSLKLIVVLVSIVTFAGFASLFALGSHNEAGTTHQQSAKPTSTGNI